MRGMFAKDQERRPSIGGIKVRPSSANSYSTVIGIVTQARRGTIPFHPGRRRVWPRLFSPGL